MPRPSAPRRPFLQLYRFALRHHVNASSPAGIRIAWVAAGWACAGKVPDDAEDRVIEAGLPLPDFFDEGEMDEAEARMAFGVATNLNGGRPPLFQVCPGPRADSRRGPDGSGVSWFVRGGSDWFDDPDLEPTDAELDEIEREFAEELSSREG